MTHGSPSTQDLTDTQLVLLSQASQRADGKVVPPAHLKGGIFKRVMASLVGKGLVQATAAPEVSAAGKQDGDPAVACPVISSAGLAALGIADNAIPGFPEGANTTPVDAGLEAMRTPRAGSKQAMVLDLLARPEGVTLDGVMTETGWRPHTARAVLSGLRKRGYGIERINGGDGGSRYRLIASGLPLSWETPAVSMGPVLSDPLSQLPKKGRSSSGSRAAKSADAALFSDAAAPAGTVTPTASPATPAA